MVSRTSLQLSVSVLNRTFPVGIEITVDWNNVIRQTGLRRFKAHKRKSTSPAGTTDAECVGQR